MIHYHKPEGPDALGLTAHGLKRNCFYRIKSCPQPRWAGQIVYRNTCVNGSITSFEIGWTTKVELLHEYRFEEIPKDEKITFTVSYDE